MVFKVNRRVCSLIFFLVMGALLSGCSVTIPYDQTYQGQINPTGVMADGYASIDMTIRAGGGKVLGADNGFFIATEAAVNDALNKHHITLEAGDGLKEYRLKVAITALPDNDLWKTAPLTGKNIGMAMIPIAGAFNKRYYMVYSGFDITFDLVQGERQLCHEAYTYDTQAEVAVSQTKRTAEALEAGIRMWEKNRNDAIEKFFTSLSSKYPLAASR